MLCKKMCDGVFRTHNESNVAVYKTVIVSLHVLIILAVNIIKSLCE